MAAKVAASPALSVTSSRALMTLRLMRVSLLLLAVLVSPVFQMNQLSS
ncbi:hypothetical protein JOS77_03235 [Chromobacterium haemolyticum]|nr:hypothetical protein JOS77_03235 [Chromobacterium haemolyticum]